MTSIEAMMGLYPPIGGAILQRFMSAIPPGSDPQPAAQPVFDYDRPQGASEFAVIWCRILAIFMLGWGLYFAASTVGNLIVYFFSPGQLRLGEVGIYATVALLPDGLVPDRLVLLDKGPEASRQNRGRHRRSASASPRDVPR
jgi:hypothetical protein